MVEGPKCLHGEQYLSKKLWGLCCRHEETLRMLQHRREKRTYNVLTLMETIGWGKRIYPCILAKPLNLPYRWMRRVSLNHHFNKLCKQVTVNPNLTAVWFFTSSMSHLGIAHYKGISMRKSCPGDWVAFWFLRCYVSLGNRLIDGYK